MTRDSGGERTTAMTMVDKIWRAHTVISRADGETLLYIDHHFLHEGSRFAFDMLARANRTVRRPHQVFSFADHYVPTRDRAAGIQNPEVKRVVDALDRNTTAAGISHFGMDHPEQGIVHVVAPELGLTLPGMTIVCGDSHTSTHGAFGALAFGIGSTEVQHVLATQTLWQRRPEVLRITVDGVLGEHISGKDLILWIIGRIGANGATGQVIEYAGSAVRALSMEGRMTVCNMSIEAGARAGMIAPDETTFAYLANTRYGRSISDFERAVASWRQLASDAGARFDHELELDAAGVAPMVTWGTSPEHVVAITDVVPDPADEADPARRESLSRALAYMDLTPGVPMTSIAIDRVFIGSCTNARIEDLRSAARVVEGRRVRVPSMIVPGSQTVKRLAESEGLDNIFRKSGFEWRDPGCSMCLAVNGDRLAPGERCAATSNRNFEGRQGTGGRTHLMSAAMAAAAALEGRFTDVRALAGG